MGTTSCTSDINGRERIPPLLLESTSSIQATLAGRDTAGNARDVDPIPFLVGDCSPYRYDAAFGRPSPRKTAFPWVDDTRRIWERWPGVYARWRQAVAPGTVVPGRANLPGQELMTIIGVQGIIVALVSGVGQAS